MCHSGQVPMLTVCWLLSLTFCAVVSVSVASLYDSSDREDRVYLPALPVLIFTRDQISLSRRGHPHKQLSCVGGTAKNSSSLFPDVVTCVNDASHGSTPTASQPKVTWDCRMEPDRENVEMENTTVFCEGYGSTKDLFVLKGSCYLEYNLTFYSKDDAASAAGADAANEGKETSKNRNDTKNSPSAAFARTVRFGLGLFFLVLFSAFFVTACKQGVHADDDDQRLSLISRRQ